jgi:MFS family permease
MAKEISGVPPLVAAGMVGIISIANGIGRLLWAWLSDAIGRPNVFLIMFLLQAALFFLMPSQRQFTVLVTLCLIVLSCYGGGFGTMPAFATDYFSPKWIGSIYGLMLTAWGFGGVFWAAADSSDPRGYGELQRCADNHRLRDACFKLVATDRARPSRKGPARRANLTKPGS